MEIFSILFRTVFFYFFIVLSYRIMGKREIGQLGIIDLIVSILIAELVAISIENVQDSIYFTIVPIILLVLLELGLAFISLKSRKFRNFFAGKPTPIIVNGKINYKQMIKQRYSLDDLLLHLRQKDVKTIDQVEYAFLETNGKLSIFKYNFLKIKTNYPMPLIVDGEMQKKSLPYIKKNQDWLIDKLTTKGLTVKDVFYAFYKNKKLYLITNRDIL